MNQSKNIFIIANIGTLLEWEEFTFYAYIASHIAKLFFPYANPHTGMIAAFSIFAIGYLTRPLGGIIFGHIGDKFGRRTALQWSIFLMGISAVGIGFLPTYATAGIYAPILLLLCRCIQGIAVSGEYNGSAIFLVEHAKKRPCLAGSWTGWTAAVGMMLGGLAAALISLPGMPLWAWRVPFLLGAVMCACGIYLRRHVQETPDFLALLRRGSISNSPLIEVLAQHRRHLILTAALGSALGIYIYLGNVYYATFLVQASGLTELQTKLIATIGEAFVILFFPICAIMADRHGSVKIIKLGLTLSLFIAPLLYLLPSTHSFFFISAGQILYAVPDAMIGAPVFKFLNDLFPSRVRCSAISFAWNLGMAIFAGTAPIVAVTIQGWTGSEMTPSFYMMLACTATLAILILIKSHTRVLYDNQHTRK